jgi:DNA-binding transcriptional ArsR family regulator
MPDQPDAFAAIADPTRRRILALLTAGALSINALADQFDISRPAVSKHVKVLEQAGLVNVEPSGRERLCALDEQGFAVIHDWLAFFQQFWTQRMRKMEAVLKSPGLRRGSRERKR